MYALLSITKYVLMFERHLIDRVCWREFVCELPGIPQALYSFCRISYERDEWLSLRSSGSSSIPSLHSLLTWLPCISDLRGSSLILVFSASSSSSSFSLLIHRFHSTFKFFLTVTHFQVWYSLHITIIHLIISLICFICLLIDTMFTLGTFGSLAHGIYYTCCISYRRAWILIIGYLGLVSLHFNHLITLAYVTSRVLRPPWGHGIRYRLQQPLLEQVFEIRLPFGYRHASSSGRHLSDG